MAADLATTPVSGLAVQACGEAHPWEWDVKRLAASLEVIAGPGPCPFARLTALVHLPLERVPTPR